MKKLVLAVIMGSFVFWACKSVGPDDPPVPKTFCDSVTYITMVKPIFTEHCNIPGCHSQGAGNVDLRTYTKCMEVCQTKEMKKSINHQLTINKNMPQGAPKLSQRNIDIIECWIAKGYPE